MESCIIAKYEGAKIEDTIEISDIPLGEERMSYVRQRVNQSFFHDIVMSSYDFKCCISGIRNAELLEACHIIDWSEDAANRCNPENGLCMNTLFHKVYDKFLIGITPDYTIVVSEEMLEKTDDKAFRKYLQGINKQRLALPTRFFPDRDLLDIHYTKFLNHQ